MVQQLIDHYFGIVYLVSIYLSLGVDSMYRDYLSRYVESLRDAIPGLMRYHLPESPRAEITAEVTHVPAASSRRGMLGGSSGGSSLSSLMDTPSELDEVDSEEAGEV